MAFTNPTFVSTSPLGSAAANTIDDIIRQVKLDLIERLEGDTANAQQSGVFEAGSLSATAIVKKGVARAFVDTIANIGTYNLQDGRLFIASDTGRMYHLKGSGATELQYIPLTGGTISGDLTVGGKLTFTTAATRVIPGATSISFRNNTNSADNFFILDGGDVTVDRGNFTVNGTAADRVIVINADAGRYRYIRFSSATSRRWEFGTDNIAESGSNAGSNIFLNAFDDAGNFNFAAMAIQRSTGFVNFAVGGQFGGNLAISSGGISVTGNSAITGTLTLTSTLNSQTISSAASFTGTVTVATGLTVTSGGIAITGGSLSFGSGSSKIVPGATSISLRNNVDSIDNLLITDAGTVTARSTLTVNAGGLIVSGGGISITGASTFSSTINSQTISSAANFTGTVAIASTVTGGTYNGQTITSAADFTGTLNVSTGFKVGGGATSGQFLRGNGTNFVGATIANSDLPAALNAATSFQIASGATITRILTATVVWDPANTAAGSFASTSVTVTGAAVGDPVFVSKVHAVDSFECWNESGYVSAADTVTLIWKNTGAGSVDPTSRTVRVIVFHI